MRTERPVSFWTRPVVSDNSADRCRAAITLRRAVIVAEKTADPLTPLNGAAVRLASDTVDQFVVQALMVAFAMIVHEELGEQTTEVPLAKRNHAIQAFFLD
jgi:hypothetical protein